MHTPKKTTEELINMMVDVIVKLQREEEIDEINFMALFEEVNTSFKTQDNLEELTRLKNILDSLFTELKKHEGDIFERLTTSGTRVTAHKAYITSAKR